MFDLSEFHFLRPDWFWSLLAFLPVALLGLRRTLDRGNWEDVCDRRLLPYILEHQAGRKSRFLWLLFGTAVLLSVIALAGPTWQRLPAPVYRDDSALVIVLDLSRSMDAGDIQPSRLGRARYKIADILQLRKDGLTALVVYSDYAYTVAPLTDDSATILSLLPALETSIMPAQGSRTSTALERAVELLKQSGNPRGRVLLISDGVEQKAFKAAEKLKREGYRLYVFGIGSQEGAPIPLQGGGFIKDSDGNIVVSRLEPRMLESLASTGGGFYQQLRSDDRDIRSFMHSFEPANAIPQADPAARQVDQWAEAGPWLLLVVLPIAAYAFRRGYLLVLLFLAAPFAQPVHAWQWKDLWQTPDQQGYRAFQQGDYESASKLFDDPAWKAASEYSAGQYEQALESLDKLDSRRTAYNKGNALARAGRFADALQAYEQALEVDPGDEDARYNRDLIKKALEQQNPPHNQSPGSSQTSNPRPPLAQNRQNGELNDSGTEHADRQAEPGQPSDRAEEADNPRNTDQGDASEESQPSNATNEEKVRAEPPPGPEGEEKFEPRQGEGRRPGDAESKPGQELQQANEQWLRRIPDDPGGLLRRKFKYQYQQADPRHSTGAESW